MIKTFRIPIILFLTIIGSFLILNIPNDKNPRDEYEQFLLAEYQKIPQMSEEELKDLPKPTRPDLAAIQNYYMTLDPDLKRVPVERLKTAYLNTESISKLKSSNAFGSDIEWKEVTSNMAGRTRAFMIDPNVISGDKAWTGSVTGGLWVNDNFKSDNSLWRPVDEFWGNLVVSCIISDPQNPNVFYVGTGEAQTAFTIYRESSGVGAGIWKTTDGGLSWAQIPSTDKFKYITDLEIRLENGSSVIYACVTSGVYHGLNHESLPSDGLYRSENNGVSWTQVLPNIVGNNKPYTPADIEIASNGRIYIGSMRNLEDNGGGTILYSDAGTLGSWTIYDEYANIIRNSTTKYNIPGRVILASAPSKPDTVYALLDVAFINPENGFKHSEGRHIIKSVNKGQSWNSVNMPVGGSYYWATIGWHALAAAVDPNDANTIFIGGLDTYKSTNGGSSWVRVSDWTGMYSNLGGRYIHADIHKIMFLNKSSNQMIVATDGGIFYTANATQNQPDFSPKNNNYNSLQFYSCAMDPRAGTNIFVGGLQDNGTVRYAGSPISNNAMIDGGDGAFCFIDQNEPEILITSIYYNRYLFFNNLTRVGTASVNYGSGTFINPSDYDDRLNILYANAITFLGNNPNKLLKITGIPSAPSETMITVTSDVNVPFSHIAVSEHSPTNTTTLFAGTQSGRLFKIKNAQNIPVTTEIGSTNFPTANISCIAIGKSEDTLLVTFSNYGVSSVWQTYNGGQSWNEKEGNLPDMPIRWALYHPYNANKAFLATEVGVWATDQLMQQNPEWVPLDNGLAKVRVDMLQIRNSDQTILAATHGRGLAYTAISQVGIDDSNTTDKTFKVYPNPANDVINVSFEISKAKKLKLMIYDPAGRMVFSEEKFDINGVYTKSIDLTSFPKGVLIINLLIDDKLISKKIIHQ
ncbi:MAG: T9SS type A sorting domain-containing protein [Bacteroidetes bacterium]|nr:T9SS type A sorting domain-containing protein [Bacteroidota bacterium]